MRVRRERTKVMTHMHATAAKPALDAGQALPADPSGGQSPALPSQVISFAIGDEQYGVDIVAVREIKGWSDPLALQLDDDAHALAAAKAALPA
jgi:hypothetical protein